MYRWHRKGDLVCTNHWLSSCIWAFLVGCTSVKNINKFITSFITTIVAGNFSLLKIVHFNIITKGKIFIAISKLLFCALHNWYFPNVNILLQHYFFTDIKTKSNIYISIYNRIVNTKIKTAPNIYHSRQK